MKHFIAHKQPGQFCGWPANAGVWIWDSEILVGFTLREYEEKPDKHSINLGAQPANVFARSGDAGNTWTVEQPDALSGQIEPTRCTGDIDFSHPDFCMTIRGGRFFLSYDRGRSWGGPFALPSFGLIKLQSRTDYIATNNSSCLLFLTAVKPNGREGRPFCARISDHGKTMEFLAWIAPEPTGYSIMPATVQIGKNVFVSAIRRHEGENDAQKNWLEVYRSGDEGQTWEFLAKPSADTGLHGGNPPSLARLSDGLLCLVYGRRRPPYGIQTVFSRDDGKTWSQEYIIRDDARTWDKGYVRTVLRPDGKLLSLYYYATERNPEQHIAGTVWEPGEIEETLQPQHSNCCSRAMEN